MFDIFVKKEKVRDKVMKKNKKPENPKRLRFLTVIMLIAISISGGINGYCFYNVFGKDIVSEDSRYSNMTEEQIEVQKLREKEKEEEQSGIISYIPTADEQSIDMVIVNESDAYDVLFSLQYDLDIYDAEHEYAYSYIRSNDYYDVYTMQQYYDNIEVYGYELKMTADKSGNLIMINGTHAQLDGFDTSVVLSEDDAYKQVLKYLKSEYQVSDDDVYVKGLGRKIVFDDNNEPSVTYLFEISDKSGQCPFRKIFLSGFDGKIISDINLILYDMVSIDLEGQLNTHKDVDVWENYAVTETAWGNKDELQEMINPRYQLYDAERKINVYQVNAENLTDENFDTSMQPVQINNGKDNASAVDALAYIQNVYDFYKETFQYIGLNGNGEQISIYNNIQTAFETSLLDNASYLTGTNSIYIGKKLNRADTCSAYLDILGHEYTHGVVYNQSSLVRVHFDDVQKSSQFSISEGLGDLFGELVDDYCDDKKLNNTCDWIHGNGNRVINNPSSSKSVQLTNANDFIAGTTDCHDGASLVSHSAYLMTCGINGTQALTNEQLANLYYYMIPNMTANTDFKNFRYLVEQNALNMNKYAYFIGPLTASGRASSELTDEQWESVVDSFDMVGIERSYDYSLTSDAKLKVYDKNNKPYSNYHITITRANDNKEIFNQDFDSSEYQLQNLKHGEYKAVMYDLENPDLKKEFTFIVNDNIDGQKSSPYKTSGKIFTKFGSDEREVVLAVDVSGSMEGTPLASTKKAALKFVKTILDVNPNIRINLITYSDTAIAAVSSSNEKKVLCNAINNMSADGGTNMYSAISKSQERLVETKTENKYMIIMSDGLPNRGKESNGSYTSPVNNIAGTLKSNNIKICSLGFFHNLQGSELSEGTSLMSSIASPGYYYNAANTSDIQDIFYDIANQVGGRTSRIVKIACPVDVTVSCNGETLSSAEDTLNTRTNFGTLSFEGKFNETKILRLDDDADYEICINGTGLGSMDYSISFADENGNYSDIRTFEDVPINPKTIICTNSGQSKNTMLYVDTDGDGKFDMNYIAGANESSKDYDKIIWTAAAVITGIILILLFVIEIVLIIKRYKINKYCPDCKSKLYRKSQFCSECGRPVKRIPLIFPEKIERKPQHKAVKIIKLSVIGICLITALGSVLIYQSASNNVFLRIRSTEFVSAKMLYNNSVADSWLGNHYLSFVTDSYLEKVQTAYQDNIIDIDFASEIYSAVADMDIGRVSDNAENYLENIK